MAEHEWAKAVTQWREALNYAPDLAPIKKQIADCERFGRDAGELERARKEFEGKNYDEAEAILKTVTPPSPYADDAKGLLARIAAEKGAQATKELVQKISKLYSEGSGEEAAKLAEDNGLHEFDYIRGRVKQWKQVMGEADAAEKAKEYENAVTKFHNNNP